MTLFLEVWNFEKEWVSKEDDGKSRNVDGPEQRKTVFELSGRDKICHMSLANNILLTTPCHSPRI